MTKLSGGDALHRTAAILLTRAQSRLVVRAMTYFVSGEYPHIGLSRMVEIYLLSYCKVPRGGHGGFFEVLYQGEYDPTLWYKLSPNPLGVRSLHPTDDLAVLQQLQSWWHMAPYWTDEAEVVACSRDPNRSFQELSPSNLHLMLHFTRLYGLILERGHHTPNAWETDDLLKRLGAFLKDRIQDWEKVIG